MHASSDSMQMCYSLSLEVLSLKLKKLIEQMKPPCPKCPYTLGEVQFIKSPCHDCKQKNYQMYHVLIKGKPQKL